MSDVVLFTAEGVSGRDAFDQKTHIRRAYVRTVDAKDSVSVLAVTDIPALGTAHPGLAGTVLMDRRPRCLGNGREWVIDFEYELLTSSLRKRPPTSATIEEAIPTDEPWEFDQDFQELQLAVTSMMEVNSPGGTDIAAANPGINTAGEPFAETITEPVWLQVLRLEKNLTDASISATTASTFQGSTNTLEIAVSGVTIPVRCGLLRRCQLQRRYYGVDNTPFWRARFEIVVFPSTITTDFAVLQRGFNELPGAPAGLTAISAPDGSEIRVPANLDADGKQSPTSFWRYFSRTNKQAWASLNLPTTMSGGPPPEE